MTGWLTLAAALMVVTFLVYIEVRWLVASARRRPPKVLESQPIAAVLAAASGRRRALRHEDGSLCSSLRGACICRELTRPRPRGPGEEGARHVA